MKAEGKASKDPGVWLIRIFEIQKENRTAAA
jgi:hypothetical protein